MTADQSGENGTEDSQRPGFIVIIPARYGSSRLPGKPLIDICGQSMIERVYRQASQSAARAVYVATDSEQIAAAVTAFGGQVLMTRADHQSGSERLAECVEQLELASDDCVVNVQGDEPLLPPELIDQVAAVLRHDGRTDMATLATPIVTAQEFENPNVVKVVLAADGSALYFSRAAIPHDRDRQAAAGSTASDAQLGLRHLGLYAYRAGFLRDYVSWPQSDIEKLESLEQLRALSHGARIRVDVSALTLGPGVDTAEDVEHVRALLLAQEK